MRAKNGFKNVIVKDTKIVHLSGQSSKLDEKELAKTTRDALNEKIMNKVVTLRNIDEKKKEMYGRILADVYLGEECINEWLIQKGYAKKYDGGHKETWD